MSGTSADAIDAALVDINNASVTVLHSLARPLPKQARAEIIALFTQGDNEVERLGGLDRLLGRLFAEAVAELLSKSATPARDIIAIGSHGQTLRHRPRPNSGSAFTLQIGDPNTIAELTGITTVADFRRRDIACGGQGAPLAPGFHQAVFAHPEQTRAVVNIGGIANLTLLAPGRAVLGFDTGPGNGLLDAWIDHCRELRYDQNGEWAAAGNVQPQLLTQLQSHPYFSLNPPKSTGREEFTLDWLLSQLDDFGFVHPQDVQATLAELTAATIAEQVQRYQVSGVYLCGGGAHNAYLCSRIAAHLPANCQLQTTAALGIPPDDVEAAAFAWLAHQTMQRLAGNVPSVTGAARAAVLGGVYPGHC